MALVPVSLGKGHDINFRVKIFGRVGGSDFQFGGTYPLDELVNTHFDLCAVRRFFEFRQNLLRDSLFLFVEA